MKLTHKAVSKTQRVLVYGPPKTGKTELAGKLAEHYNLIWCDIEQGWVTLTKMPKEWQERIELVSIPDSRILPMGCETWLKMIKGTEVFICEAHGKCSCALCKKQGAPETRVCLNETPSDTIVVFDSLTQFTNSCISHITKSQPEDYKLQLDDWGNLRVLIDKFLSQVQAARYNIVCITHEEEVEMEDGKSKLVPVSGSSKSSRNTAKYFDHVVYVEVRNKKHVAGSSTDYSNSAITGSRTGVILEKCTNASLLDIFTSWKENSDEHNSGRSDSMEHTSREFSSNTVDDKGNLEEPPAKESTKEVVTDPRTPGQIALDNLRAKMTLAK